MTRSAKVPYRSRRLATVLISAGLLVIVAAVAVPSTDATWTQPNYHNAALSSGKVYPVLTVSCPSDENGRVGDDSLVISWTRGQITGNGLTPTGYTLTWTATGGDAVTGSRTTTSATTFSTTVTSSALEEEGTWRVTVIANYGTGGGTTVWTSDVSTAFRTIEVERRGRNYDWTCS
jgi:hypothetical protein